MKTITNYHKRNFLYGYEVPDEVYQDYDHLDEDERFDHWIKYRGEYYHLSDFMRFDYGYAQDYFLKNFADCTNNFFWQAYNQDTFFSQTVIRLNEDDYHSGETDELTYTIGLQFS